MTQAELMAFYEKLYFHEIEAREKLHGRLQLPLTLLLATGGAVLFLFQNFEYAAGSWTAPRAAFVFFFSCGCVLMACGLVWFVKALYNNAYYFLPDSTQTASYKAVLEETYANYEERRELVSDASDKYLTDYYIEYAAFNTAVNDRRSAYIHLCNGAIIGAALLFFLAYLMFYFGGLGRSKIKPPTEISISRPVDVRIQERTK